MAGGQRWLGREPSLTRQEAERLREIAERDRPKTRALADQFQLSPRSVRAYVAGYSPKRHGSG